MVVDLLESNDSELLVSVEVMICMNNYPMNKMQNIGVTRIVCHLTRQNHILSHRCQSRMAQMGLHHQQNGFGDLNKKRAFLKNIAFCVVKYVKRWIHDIQIDGAQ